MCPNGLGGCRYQLLRRQQDGGSAFPKPSRGGCGQEGGQGGDSSDGAEARRRECPEPDGSTALHWGAFNDFEIADLLIRAGANAKATNRAWRDTALSGKQHGNAAIIEALWKAGAIQISRRLKVNALDAGSPGWHRPGRER
jgi:hypothetical protein